MEKKQIQLLEQILKELRLQSVGHKTYLTVREAATYSGIAEYLIREYLKNEANTLPHMTSGSKFLINKNDLDTYLENLVIANTNK